MAISPSSVAQIVAVIRQQIAAPVNKSANTVPISNPRAPKRLTAKSIQQTREQGLGKLIGQRVAALKKTDPDRGRKAFRIFLESVLINELGENLINDPGFYQIVEDVQAQMENMPEIAEAMRMAISQLLNDTNSA